MREILPRCNALSTHRRVRPPRSAAPSRGASSYARLRAGAQLVVERAAGPRIWDADGNCYLDYCGGYGVNLFGHAPSFVWDAVRDVVAAHPAFPGESHPRPVGSA